MECPFCDSEKIKRINTSFPREFECMKCHQTFIEEDFSEYE